jgi:hypothetical protein
LHFCDDHVFLRNFGGFYAIYFDFCVFFRLFENDPPKFLSNGLFLGPFFNFAKNAKMNGIFLGFFQTRKVSNGVFLSHFCQKTRFLRK